MLNKLAKPAKGTALRERRKRRRKTKTKETDAKRDVRLRDRYCRFPLCGCKRAGYALHVSHKVHKGMGGNPAGDRSTADSMVYICAPRHREHVLSIDRGTLRWVALTPMGAEGPIAWEYQPGEVFLPLTNMLMTRLPVRGEWFELARERSIHVYEPLTEVQKGLLKEIARMQV